MALQSVPKTIPLDAALAIVLAAIDEADGEQLVRVIAALSTASAKASCRLLSLPQPEASSAPDRVLDVNEAAVRLGRSVHYLYRHAGKFPFKVEFGRKLGFSEQGIERFIRQKQRSGR